MSFVVPDDVVLVADGGLATELEARGNDLSDSLWSARLLMDAPDEVREAHLAFFRAGAVIATSASYQASFEGFAGRGLGRRDAAGLLRRSVELAREARAEVAGDGRARWVAASVGPYGAALADGSEYRGRYGLSVRELAAWHRPRLEAFAVAAGVPEVVAVGVNCCGPADVLAAIAAAREATGKPVIAYPNSGESWDAGRRAWTGQSRYSARLPGQWIAAGAGIIGGCCRVRPADIAAIAEAAADAGQANADGG
jgi:homocysteine S-methyltransferase